MSVRQIDLNKISEKIDLCCNTIEECGSCKRTKCLIGFSKIALEYAKSEGVTNLPQGPDAVPKDDVKIFYKDRLEDALLNIILQCRECQDDHIEECIINCIRVAVEVALLGDYLKYEGNAFKYLLELVKKNPEIGDRLLLKYKEEKNKN